MNRRLVALAVAHRFRVARGLPLGLESEPDPPQWVSGLDRDAQERR